jgi:hypothetical protein
MTLVASVRNESTPQLFLSQDIGPCGMTVLRPDGSALAERTPLRVEFELPGGAAVRARARVAYDRGSGRWRRMGLEFTGIDPKEAAMLSRFFRGEFQKK